MASRIYQNKSKLFLLLIAAMVVGILITRVVTISHGLDLHPDESVFTAAARSVVVDDYQYRTTKPYPNGAFVFYMPFQFLSRILELKVDGYPLSPTGADRIGAVFYFIIGCVIGMFILRKLSGNSLWPPFFFAVIMVFSLFQTEQSRYGTGDPISFMLIMIILLFIDIYSREQDRFYLFASAASVGVLTAVKFPLIFFLVLPISAVIINSRSVLAGSEKKSKIKPMIGIVFFALVGLLLFSPAWFSDHSFFMNAFFTELKVYAVNDSWIPEPPFQHLLSLIIYQTLYSDFPFAFPIAILGVILLYRQNKVKHFTNAIYTLILPILMLFFFIYNLFASVLFYRTYYPYFCICILYTSYALGIFMRKKRVIKVVIAALSLFMIIRGSLFIYEMANDSPVASLTNTLQNHEKWEGRSRVVVISEFFVPGGYENIPDKKYLYGIGDLLDKHDYSIYPGEFVITGAVDYWLAHKGIFVSRDDARYNGFFSYWNDFKDENKKYLIGETLPESFYFFYGAWMPGSTLSQYEFPVTYVYYRDYGN